MTSPFEPRDPFWRSWRGVSAALGALLVLLTVRGVVLGGGLHGLGRVEWMSLAGGAVLIAAARLGRRMAHAYRDTGLMLLNILVLLLLLEFGAAIALRVLPPPRSAERDSAAGVENIAWYTSKPWAAAFWREHFTTSPTRVYEPFVIWRNGGPFTSTLVNVGADHLRRTPGSDCRPGVPRIAVFGGSTVWGWGSPDWGTIPAYLQEALTQRGVEACVVNYGQPGYVSMQELIELERQLEAGNVPALAIFYDGFNDCVQAWAAGDIGSHEWRKEVAARFDERRPTAGNPLGELVRRTSLFEVAARLSGGRVRGAAAAPPEPARETEPLASATASAYIANTRMIEGLAQRFGFAWIRFVQPWIGVSGKRLTAEERRVKSRPSTPFCRAIYDHIKVAVTGEHGMRWLGDALDAADTTMFIDQIHLIPLGNERVAKLMVPALPPFPSASARPRAR